MIRALIIEDDPSDFDLMTRTLVRHFEPRGRRVISVRVYSEPALLAALDQEWAVAICDYLLPGFEWPRALHVTRALSAGLPFIVVSGVMGDDKGRQAIEAGADEYLGKDRIDQLGPVVERYVRMNAAILDNHRTAVELIDTLKQKGFAG